MTQIEKDIEEIIQKKFYFKDFKNSTFLITGATGLIGSLIIKALLSFSRKNDFNIKIFANCRSEKKFESTFLNYKSNSLTPIYSDILTLDISNLNIDYIIHGASITDSKMFVEKPVETISTTILGTVNLLKQLVGKKISGFIYLSSLEVYGSYRNSDNIVRVSESDSGYIDTLSVRSSYSESKRMVETICCSYAAEYLLPIKIARLCQTFGAGVEYSDNRVFAQFAKSVIENVDIHLKTKGETIRNYCYTTDAITGILTVLSKGKNGEAYNIANTETTISIYDMAKLCCRINGNINTIFDISTDATKLGYNPIVKIELQTDKLNALGWTPSIPLEQMFSRLIISMKESKFS